MILYISHVPPIDDDLSNFANPFAKSFGYHSRYKYIAIYNCQNVFNATVSEKLFNISSHSKTFVPSVNDHHFSKILEDRSCIQTISFCVTMFYPVLVIKLSLTQSQHMLPPLDYLQKNSKLAVSKQSKWHRPRVNLHFFIDVEQNSRSCIYKAILSI